MEAPAAHGRTESEFLPLKIGVLVVSDTRTLETDTSGALLEAGFRDAGHDFRERLVVKDDAEVIRNVVVSWCNRPDIEVIVVTGGTGVTARDVTPDALEPVYDKPIPGFGELFRWLSYREIGASTIQSRATAGLIQGCLVFALPGSRGACRLALEEILLPQLDSRTKPCSFAGLLPKL